MKKVLSSLLMLFVFSTIIAENLSKPLLITTQEWAPYNYTEDGIISGLATDILAQTLSDMKVQYQIKVYPWARAQFLVQNAKADAFYSASQNSKRDAYAIASEQILPQRWNWYLLKSSNLDPSQESFKSKGSVGAILGSNMLKSVQDNDYKVKAQPPVIESLVKMLTAKRIDAILVNDLVMKEYLKEAGIPENSFKTVLSKDKPLRIYFSKKFINENPWFLDKFNETLKKYNVK